MQIWTVAEKSKKSFMEGHPWVFANELVGNLKSVQPGELVELQDEKKRFLAIGYGNPHSRIAFRALSREKILISNATEFVIERLLKAAVRRASWGFSGVSHRLCFSEGDGLPGLIIDCFFTSSALGPRQVFVLQILTAGMEKLLKNLDEILKQFILKLTSEGLNYLDFEQSTFIIKRDSSNRKQEVLEIFPPQVINPETSIDLKNCALKLQSPPNKEQSISLYADLIDGQKTGFFLDQSSNVLLLSQYIKKEPIKILDLFCYVGQWGAQMSYACGSRESEVLLVDASTTALQFAQKNAEQFCDNVKTLKLDIVSKSDQLPEKYFDVVICDPPALIKAKKDYHNGYRAYQKVNQYALRAVKPGGYFMSCSCSQPLSEKDLKAVVEWASKKENIKLTLIGQGEQSPDHPRLKGFTQGLYLKSFLYRVD